MIVASTGSPETSYILAAFLLFLSAGLAIVTRAPQSLREKAKIITTLEPGKLYSGHFIYQPNYVSETDESDLASSSQEPQTIRFIPRLFGFNKRKAS